MTLVGRGGSERRAPGEVGERGGEGAKLHHQPAVKGRSPEGLLAAVATDRREVSAGGRVRAPLRFFWRRLRDLEAAQVS